MLRLTVTIGFVEVIAVCKINGARKYVQTPIIVISIFFPLANGFYFKVVIEKTPLDNRNSPIMDPITKIGVAHTVELQIFLLKKLKPRPFTLF